MNTSHIRACREAWLNHQMYCTPCKILQSFPELTKCEQGAVLYEEYQTAITAHPDCEHQTDTLPKEPTT